MKHDGIQRAKFLQQFTANCVFSSLLFTKCIYGDVVGVIFSVYSGIWTFLLIACLVLHLFPKLASSHCHPLCTELAFSLGKEIITLMLRTDTFFFFSWKAATVARPHRNSTIVVMLAEALGFANFVTVTVSPRSSLTIKHYGSWCKII